MQFPRTVLDHGEWALGRSILRLRLILRIVADLDYIRTDEARWECTLLDLIFFVSSI